MSKTTAQQMREWHGPAILSYGFRPMFLLAGLWALIAMVVWILMLAGLFDLPTRFDPVAWHTHEFLFGYISAVIAGFLLTAVPNWTGRLPVVGWHLGGLAALWLVGRIAVALSELLDAWVVMVADISFLLVLALVILREIVAGKNWRNMPVLGLVGALILANALFHFANEDGFGLRFGVSVVLVLVMLIGGRIIPSFTRNWLAKRNAAKLPTPPMQRFDLVVVLASVGALVCWMFAPDHALTAIALLLFTGLHGVRLSRWQGLATLKEPLVVVLHVAYGFLPLGGLAMAIAILNPQFLSAAAAVHLWTTGAIALMTLAVMTRATLGHSGRALLADRATTLIYLALTGSVVVRVLADVIPEWRSLLLNGSAGLWIVCFAGYLLMYAPLLVRRKQA